MKKINDYWVDDDNNKWSTSIYNKEQVLFLSRSLIDCKNCNFRTRLRGYKNEN